MSGNFIQTASKAITTAFRNQSSNLLIGVGVAATIATAYFVAKETPEVNRTLEEKKEEKGEDLTVTEKAIIYATGYRKSAASLAVAVGAPIMAHIKDLDKIATYSAAYSMASDKFDKLNRKMEEELGVRKTQKIHDAINEEYVQSHPPVEGMIYNTGKGVSLCIDDLSGGYFYSDRDHIDKAVAQMRVMLAEDGYASKNDWFMFLGIEPTSDGDDTGWNRNNTPFDIEYTSCLTSDGRPCLVICHSYNLPNPDFRNYY